MIEMNDFSHQTSLKPPISNPYRLTSAQNQRFPADLFSLLLLEAVSSLSLNAHCWQCLFRMNPGSQRLSWVKVYSATGPRSVLYFLHDAIHSQVNRHDLHVLTFSNDENLDFLSQFPQHLRLHVDVTQRLVRRFIRLFSR